MSILNIEEINFINRALRLILKQSYELNLQNAVKYYEDLEEIEMGKLDVSKREDINTIISTYRAKGLIASRRGDGGKEFDLWGSIKKKLTEPIIKVDLIEERDEDVDLDEDLESPETLAEIDSTIKIEDSEPDLTKIETLKEEPTLLEKALQEIEKLEIENKKLKKVIADLIE